jgi:hypothetical protein
MEHGVKSCLNCPDFPKEWKEHEVVKSSDAST